MDLFSILFAHLNLCYHHISPWGSSDAQTLFVHSHNPSLIPGNPLVKGAGPNAPLFMQKNVCIHSFRGFVIWNLLTNFSVEFLGVPVYINNNPLPLWKPNRNKRNCKLRVQCHVHVSTCICNPKAFLRSLKSVWSISINANWRKLPNRRAKAQTSLKNYESIGLK